MPGPELKGKATLDDSQVDAAMRRIQRIGQVTASHLDAQFKKAGSSMASAGKAGASQISGALASLTAPLAAVGAAMTAAFAGKAIASGVAQIFDAGRALSQLSRQTGAGVGALVVLQAKFKAAGLDGDAAGESILKLQKVIGGMDDEGGKGGAALQRLGLNLANLQKLAPDQQLFAVGKAIGAVQDPAERTADAMAIFGREGGKLVGVFRQQDFGTVGEGLQQKAAMMERNAAIFERVSVKLERVGAVAKTFYAGVADRVVKTLDPLLNRLDRINLVGFGQQVGDALTKVAQGVVGMFSNPQLMFEGVAEGLAYAFAQGGNALAAVAAQIPALIQDVALPAFEGLGDKIIAVLMRAFDAPVRFLQAGIEQAMEVGARAMDKLQGKDDDVSGYGALGAEGRKGRMDQIDKMLGGVREQYGSDPAKYLKAPAYIEGLRQREALRTYDPSKYATQVESVDAIYNHNKNDPLRFGLANGGDTADEYDRRGSERLSLARSGAADVWHNFNVPDVNGAKAHLAKAMGAASKLQAIGATAIQAWAQKAGATQPTPAAAATDKTLAWMRSNDTSDYGKKWDAYRQQQAAALHTIGRGSALGFSEAAARGDAWTGAANPFARFRAANPEDPDQVALAARERGNYFGTSGGVFRNQTSLTTGGLGGGAYGRSGNIWHQISGYGPGGRPQSSEEKSLGHLAGINSKMDTLVKVWTEGGGGGKGGGATVTGK